MANPSKSQMLQIALQRGLINQDQYQKGLSKLETNQEDGESLSKRKMLDLALERGLIQPEQYEKGLQRLESPNIPQGEQNVQPIEKPSDDYSLRREKALKKVEIFPEFVKKLYGEHLYPTREKMDEDQKNIAKGARNIATLPGAVLDLPMLPINLGLAASGKEAYVPSQMIGNAIDTATGGYTRPETNSEKVNEAVMQSVLPMGAIGKGAGYLAQQAPKAIQKVGKFFQSSNALNPANVAATAGGSAATQEFVNRNPNSGFVANLLAGYAGSKVGGMAGKNIKALTRPQEWAAQKLDISPAKVKNQLKDSQGNYLTSTLGDISNSENLQMAQHVAEKTPFVGKRITRASDAGIRSEQEALNKNGLVKALGAEDTGELALEGISNYENQIAKRDIENYGKVQEGLKKHAKPYEQPPYILSKDMETGRSDLIPNSKKHLSEFEIKDPKQREKIDFYTGKSIKDMSKMPINLVPFSSTKKFIGKQFSNVDHPAAQDSIFKEKFGEIVSQLDDIALSYNREGVPYKSFQSLRKKIDDSITTWGQTGDVAKEKLKNFRRVMHKDTGNYLEQLDPELRKQWDQANKLKSSYMKNELPLINDIKKVADKKTVEDVTKNLLTNLKNAGRKVHIAAKGLNQDKKSMLGYSLFNEMGKNAQEEFNLFTAANKYRQIKGGGKKALLSLFPEEKAADLDRSMRRIGNIQERLNRANTSRSGYFNNLFKLVRNPVRAVGTIASALPLAEMYSNKKFINWVSKGAEMTSDIDLQNHVKKLGTMKLGSNILNQEVRSLYDKMMKVPLNKENED